MKQPAVTPKKPSNAWILLVISVILVALSIAGFAVFINLNRTIKMTSGKVVDSYTKKEFASRKQTVDQEYEIVKYAVDGKEFSGKTAAPKTGSSSQYETVYYYEKFPGMPWFRSKSNSSMAFCSLFAALSLALLAYSGYRLRKNAQAAAALKKQQPKKNEKKL
jgi:cell division protein FtsB